MSPGIKTSEDPIKCKNQKGDSRWKRINALYQKAQEENLRELSERNMQSMKGRYKRLNENGGKWAGACFEANEQKTSGMSNKDIEREAHIIHEAESGKFLDQVVFDEVMG